MLQEYLWFFMLVLFIRIKEYFALLNDWYKSKVNKLWYDDSMHVLTCVKNWKKLRLKRKEIIYLIFKFS